MAWGRNRARGAGDADAELQAPPWLRGCEVSARRPLAVRCRGDGDGDGEDWARVGITLVGEMEEKRR